MNKRLKKVRTVPTRNTYLLLQFISEYLKKKKQKIRKHK